MRAMIIYVAMLAGACLMITPSNSLAANWDIVSGVRAGNVKLGDSVREVYSAMGDIKADKVKALKRKCGNTDITETLVAYNDMGLMIIFDSNNTVVRIIVTSSEFTVNGISLRVGDNKNRLSLLNTKSEPPTPRGSRELYTYPRLGLRFLVDTGSATIVAIIIASPGAVACQ